MTEPDDELLQQAIAAREGDLRAFEQLVIRHQKRIVADCRHITHDNNNAEDLAQEVFVKAFFGVRRFEGRSSFRHWLQRIKVNHCLTYLKKQKGKTLIDIEDDDLRGSAELSVPPAADRHAEAMSDREQIVRILDSMSATLRIPLVLCDIDELSYEEIASALGISLSAVKMRIKRAREEFRGRYQSGPAQKNSKGEYEPKF